MGDINKVKSITLWIFIVPFFAINICLILITNFHPLFHPHDIIHKTIPYIDGGASISRTARVYPTYLIFKPAMFFTAYLLCRYWIYNKNIIKYYDKDCKHLNMILFFGIGSAILIIVHSIFLGIKFDHSLYKLFRRIVIILFVFFEIIAQGYLVYNLYKIKKAINKNINLNFLEAKRILVSLLVIFVIISLPIVSVEGNKQLKHALEWNFFVGVISFYLLTFFMWKKNYKN